MPSSDSSFHAVHVHVEVKSPGRVFSDLVKGYRKCLVAGLMVCTVKGAAC